MPANLPAGDGPVCGRPEMHAGHEGCVGMRGPDWVCFPCEVCGRDTWVPPVSVHRMSKERVVVVCSAVCAKAKIELMEIDPT